MPELAIPTERTRDRVKVPVPSQADVVIIGAGLGGLVSGAHLAREGRKVVILDQHYVAGGCATMFHRTTRDGRYQFDIGLHYIGDCGEDGKIPSLLRELDISLDYIPMDDDGFDTIVLPDLTFPVPTGHDRYRDRLVEFFPGETRGIDRYVRLLKEVDHMATFMEQRRNGGSAENCERSSDGAASARSSAPIGGTSCHGCGSRAAGADSSPTVPSLSSVLRSSSVPSWNQLWRQRAQRTVRPFAPMALSGTA